MWYTNSILYGKRAVLLRPFPRGVIFIARPLKDGVDYFPFDVVLNEKFELIEAEFGLTGFAVVVKLYQRVYQQGYYCEWTNEVALLFGHKVGLGGNAVSEIVNAAIRRGIFDSNMFGKYHILTSVGIQKRYFEAVSRRKCVNVKKVYLLVDVTQFVLSTHIIWINDYNNPENASNNSQSKVNESKVNETKGTTPTPPCVGAAESAPYSEIKNLYLDICKSYPRIQALSDARRKAIHARWVQYHDINIFQRLFEMAEESDFLKGNNNRNWHADFDWLLKDRNMPKVLEGRYKSRNSDLSDSSTGNIFADIYREGHNDER